MWVKIKYYDRLTSLNENSGSKEQNARNQLTLALEFTQDQNIINQIAALQNKYVFNPEDYQQISQILEEVGFSQDALTAKIEAEKEQIKEAAINLVLAQDNADELIDKFKNLKIFDEKDIKNIERYKLLQEESADRAKEIVEYYDIQ